MQINIPLCIRRQRIIKVNEGNSYDMLFLRQFNDTKNYLITIMHSREKTLLIDFKINFDFFYRHPTHTNYLQDGNCNR